MSATNEFYSSRWDGCPSGGTEQRLHHASLVPSLLNLILAQPASAAVTAHASELAALQET